MDQARALAGRHGADVDLPLAAGRQVGIGADPLGDHAQLHRERLDRFDQLLGLPGLGGVVLDHAAWLAAETAGPGGALLVDLDDPLFVGVVGVGLLAGDEACTQPDADRPHHQGRRNPASIADAARCQHRDLHGVQHCGQERQSADASGMAAGVVALGDHDVDSARGDAGGVARVADQRHHLDAQLVSRRHHGPGVAETAGQDGDPLLEHYVDLRLHLAGEGRGRLTGRGAADGREQEVDAKRTIRQAPDLLDLLAQPLGVQRRGADHAQAARRGNPRGQLTARHVSHARLDDRHLDAQHFTERCPKAPMHS